MLTNNEIEYLIKFIDKKKHVYGRNLLTDPFDFLNASLIKCIDSGKTPSINTLKPFIVDSIFAYGKESLPFELNNFKSQGGQIKRCNKCNEYLPIELFHIHRKYLSGYISYKGYCKKCGNIYANESLKKRRLCKEYNNNYLKSMRERQKQRELIIKNNPRLNEYFKEIKKQISKNWYLQNVDRCNERARICKQKTRQNLGRPYIYNLLKKKFKKHEITEEMIDQKRISLLIKREKRI